MGSGDLGRRAAAEEGRFVGSTPPFGYKVVGGQRDRRLAIDKRGPMSGDFDVKGEVKPLWDIFFGGDRALSGQVELRGTLAGSLYDPRVRGHASMTGGALEDYGTGVVVSSVFGGYWGRHYAGARRPY